MLSGAEPLLLVGAGKMGGALLDGWLENGLQAAQVTVVDPGLPDRRRSELRRAGVRVAERSEDAAGRGYKAVVIAVKPQMMAETLPALPALVTRDTIVVSVAAGIRVETLQAPFGGAQPVVRAMPNTPAQVGQGMTVALANPHVTDAQRKLIDAMLGAVGKVAWTEDESLIDAVTAVSGSGPAYVFLLTECLAEAGRQAGLPVELAEQLARQTVIGAGALMAESPLPASELRENVTSPNGTTAAALGVLMADDGLQLLMTRAVEAARRRSVELG
jgi:pyrroline-5-carboxylate reductase